MRPTEQSQSGPYYGIFNDSFPPILDGVTLTVENYARWLSAKGNTPCVVTPWNPVRTRTDYEVMRYFSLPIWNRRPYRYGYPKLDPFIWRRLARTPFAIVHAHCPFSSGRLALYVRKRQGVPLVGTFHSKYRTDLERGFRHAPWCVPVIMRRILDFFNACDEVWIPQAQVAETVREYGFRGELTVVENGNDFAGLDGGDLAGYRRESRRQLGIPENVMSLIFVGQHIWEKGVGVIMDALKLLKGRVDFRMTFIGDGYAASDMAEKIKVYGLGRNVRMLGVIRDRRELSRHYAASDIFLFPSLYDNAPLVVREAAAMGTPSILVGGATAAEVVTDGRNGFLALRSPEDYADLIEHLAKDPDTLRRVGDEARLSLVRSWRDVVDEVADRYDTLMRNFSHRRVASLSLT